MSMAGKWGYSHNEEMFTGAFDTREEAIAEAIADDDDDRPVRVGQYEDPVVEEAIDGSDLIDKVLCRDDYSGDWAEGSIDATREQVAELTDAVRRVFGEWLDKHSLRPQFGIIWDSEKIE